MSVLRMPEPTENDNTYCYLQQDDTGSLICRAAQGHTDKVNRNICFNCDAGKICRETGCNEVFPENLRIIKVQAGACFGAVPKHGQLTTGYYLSIKSLFCRRYKRETTLDFCRTCDDPLGAQEQNK